MLEKVANSNDPDEALAAGAQSLHDRLQETRTLSTKIAEPLSDEDQVVQAMEDASPTKWHLAHTTWFFETFILKQFDEAYAEFDEKFGYCFNSYYETVGDRHPRPSRGLLTRPSNAEVRDYRAHVDAALEALFAHRDNNLPHEALELVELGINHEQQHQELMLTDILALFARQPLKPVYAEEPAHDAAAAADLEWVDFDGGIHEIGHQGDGFAFDNEAPVHKVLIHPFKLANRTVTNGEWLQFIADGGYESPNLWLADGLATVRELGWRSPLYWEETDDGWQQMGLHGLKPVDPAAPVTHISYFEADAYARWDGKRLPTEFEWEVASTSVKQNARAWGDGPVNPVPAVTNGARLNQMFGEVWEWTQSAYASYPGFKPAEGAVGEYNGKFMCNQFVLRGGSCVTPPGHVRATYRNFFYPHQRWQFTGLRLASD